jgi:hypothetical protein
LSQQKRQKKLLGVVVVGDKTKRGCSKEAIFVDEGVRG